MAIQSIKASCCPRVIKVALPTLFVLLLTCQPFIAFGIQHDNLYNKARDLYREVLFISERSLTVEQAQDTIKYYSGKLEQLGFWKNKQHVSAPAHLEEVEPYINMISDLLNKIDEQAAGNVNLESPFGGEDSTETMQNMESARGFIARNHGVLVSAGILTVLLMVMILTNRRRLMPRNQHSARSKQVKPKSHYQIKKELFASGKENGKIKI